MVPDRHAVVDELAALRRRAYGPGGDIDSEPAARARLAELEEAARRARDPEAAVDSLTRSEPAAQAVAPETTEATDAAPPRSGTPGKPAAGNEPGAEASDSSRRSGRLRSRLPWAIAAIAAMVAIIAVAAAVVGAPGALRPELSLPVIDQPEDVRRPPLDTGMLDYWGVSKSALEYRGRVGLLDIWTLAGDEDVVCIFFSSSGEYWGQNCAVRPLPPIVEMRTSNDMLPTDSLAPEVPLGSFIRFMWEGDVVNVYVVRT